MQGSTLALDKDAILLIDINVDFGSSKKFSKTELSLPKSSSAT